MCLTKAYCVNPLITPILSSAAVAATASAAVGAGALGALGALEAALGEVWAGWRALVQVEARRRRYKGLK